MDNELSKGTFCSLAPLSTMDNAPKESLPIIDNEKSPCQINGKGLGKQYRGNCLVNLRQILWVVNSAVAPFHSIVSQGQKIGIQGLHIFQSNN